MEQAGLMNQEQYNAAEAYLISWMQTIHEKMHGHVMVPDSPVGGVGLDGEDCFDDPCIKSHSVARDRALEEYRIFCNLCKRQRNRPKSFHGATISLGGASPIEMGKVAEPGEDIRANPPFEICNLANFIDDEGHFDLARFFQLQQHCFPTLYKIAVCLASVRTNEVGCERFFSTAGYVSCPRCTRLDVRNYECLSMLKSNMTKVFIDEEWVVEKYLEMEKGKTWKRLHEREDLRVLELEREILAESLGVPIASMPSIDLEETVTVDLLESDSDNDLQLRT
jgi:hAT family C-terminal dimerisation region